MQVTICEFGDEGKKVVLVGKLDIAGAQEIELPLATVAGSRCNIVVDMVEGGARRHGGRQRCLDRHDLAEQ